jgi:hypothetical protein
MQTKGGLENGFCWRINFSIESRLTPTHHKENHPGVISKLASYKIRPDSSSQLKQISLSRTLMRKKQVGAPTVPSAVI